MTWQIFKLSPNVFPFSLSKSNSAMHLWSFFILFATFDYNLVLSAKSEPIDQACEVLMATLIKNIKTFGDAHKELFVSGYQSESSSKLLLNAAASDLTRFNKSSCEIIRMAASSPGTMLDDLKVDLLNSFIGNEHRLSKRGNLLTKMPKSESIEPSIRKPIMRTRLRRVRPAKTVESSDPFQLSVDPLNEFIVRNAIKGLNEQEALRLLSEVKDMQQLYSRLESLIQDSSDPHQSKFWKVAKIIVDSSDWHTSYSLFIKQHKLGPEETDIVHNMAKLSPPPSLGFLELAFRIPMKDLRVKGLQNLKDDLDQVEYLLPKVKSMSALEFIEFQKQPGTRGFLKYLNHGDSIAYLELLKLNQDQFSTHQIFRSQPSKSRLSRLRIRKKKSQTQKDSRASDAPPTSKTSESESNPEDNPEDDVSRSLDSPTNYHSVWKTHKGLIIIITLSMLVVAGVLTAALVN